MKSNFSKRTQLQHVMENCLYYHHFQPIMDVYKYKTLGYESLLRSKHIDNPRSLFCEAINSDRLSELDISSIGMAIQSFNNQLDRITRDTHLFVNIYPSTLISQHFMRKLINIIESTLISPNRIVMEINESEQINNFSDLKDTVFQLKARGIKVALDDFDNGTAPFKKVIELEPNYIKFDKYFSENLTQSIKKQEILKSLLHYCSSNNIQTILEGIETDKDLSVAKSLGIDFGQGFLTGKPDLLDRLL